MFDQSKLFFIVGVGRSGTSLLQEIMNTFDGFCNIRESRIGGPGNLDCYEFIRASNDFSYLENFIVKNWTKKYFVEKTPSSISFLKELNERYPNANYIFLQRNPYQILLSQLNHVTSEEHEKIQIRRLELGLKIGTRIYESFEEFKASTILDQIRNQVKNMKLFKNQITIRYEDLLKDLDRYVSLLESKFQIKCNYEEARKCLSRPSWSSKNNKYEVKILSDPKAILYINRACKLWDYPFSNLSQ